ncbi:MAG TPA: VacJ family lipoprotein [Moraxellaceae bacterium]|nr:VacJ family lipoprotein [Moraxellaceae bacterium]
MKHRGLLLALALLATPALAEEVATPAAATTPAARNPDPWEVVNRRVFRFNDRLDRYAFKPVAKGYRKVVPRQLRSGIGNFFRNLKMPVVMLNDLLQGKVRAAGHDVSRFFVNSTLGFVGFVDASSVLGIPRNDEDFGQTLAVWGVPQGPYVVLPFFGPSTTRDTGGLVVDLVTDPVSWEFEEGVTASLWALKVTNTRANLLDVEEIIQGDRYLFIRDLYLQSRDFAVKDGRVESDPFLDEDSDAGDEGDGGDETAPEAPAGVDADASPASGDGAEGGAVQDSRTPGADAPAIDNSTGPTSDE